MRQVLLEQSADLSFLEDRQNASLYLLEAHANKSLVKSLTVTGKGYLGATLGY